MLCDDIASDQISLLNTDTSALRVKVAAAIKFELDPDFAAVAEALSFNFDNLYKAAGFCRLPFPLSWIEVAQSSRPQFNSSEIHAPKFQSRPKRVGFLCETTRPDLSAWKTHLLWSFNDGTTSASQMAHEFDMGLTYDFDELRRQFMAVADKDDRRLAGDFVIRDNVPHHPGWVSSSERAKIDVFARITKAIPDFLPEAIPGVLSADQWAAILTDIARADWAGELVYLLAVVALLNSPNAIQKIAVDNTRLNTKRAHRGNRPLANYYRLRIHPLQVKRAGPQGPNSEHRNLRAHFVAGHWKVRRTGIFFWKPHKRGSITKGEVAKSYLVSG